MRNTLTVTLLAALLSLGGSTPALASSLPAINIGIAPSKLQMRLTPGRTAHAVIRAYNKGTRPIVLDVLAEDYSIDATSNITLMPAGTLPSSAASWTSFSPPLLRIGPGQMRQLGVTIVVPPTATVGTHTLAVVFKSRAIVSGSGGLRYQPAVASLLAAGVTNAAGGGLVVRGSVSASSVRVHFMPLWHVRSVGDLIDSLFHPTVSTQLQVRNTGNTFFNILPSTVEFSPGLSLGGSSQQVALPHYTILPGSTREINETWSSAPFFGRATIAAHVNYNSSSALALPAVGVLVIPWNLVIITGGLLALVAVVSVARRRKARTNSGARPSRPAIWADDRP